jgi:predicted RNA-binding protein associated with RNAse of E/G family
MHEYNHFSPGQAIILREVVNGKVWGAVPFIVVQDKPELTALYMPDGAVTKMPTRTDSGRVKPNDRVTSTWILQDRDWNKLSLLRLNIPGSIYSVLVFWNAVDGSHRSWYINMEEPLRRTATGFEFLDQWLDIIIRPDLSEWYWKDEDEFAEAIDLGLISKENAAYMRAEGERVAKWIQSGESPFNGWEKWRPDSSWQIPVLPEGWDNI